MSLNALCLYAGPRALAHIRAHGLQPAHIATVAGAAGGPKGLILGPLDRFLFGQWLPQSQQPIDLVGASIGAWRMATACFADPAQAFAELEHAYIHQHIPLPPGRKRHSAAEISASFSRNLDVFFGGQIEALLAHPRYRLHIVTSRGRHVLGREHKVLTPLGYLGATASNALHRKTLGAWLERVVFSSAGAALPFATHDLPTRQVTLSVENFKPALQASCSIPFVLQAVHDIPGAPGGAYWDGGITDYHLHLAYHRPAHPAQTPAQSQIHSQVQSQVQSQVPARIVLYPHFQRALVPGWLDKGWRWRHRATPFLADTLVLAPHPSWVAALPHAKLPDRTDFTHYGQDVQSRARVWQQAVSASHQLAEEWQAWLDKPDTSQVQAL